MKKKEKTDYDLRRWRQLCNLHSILKIDVILHSNYIFFCKRGCWIQLHFLKIAYIYVYSSSFYKKKWVSRFWETQGELLRSLLLQNLLVLARQWHNNTWNFSTKNIVYLMITIKLSSVLSKLLLPKFTCSAIIFSLHSTFLFETLLKCGESLEGIL